jgi:putative ABC transport system ATP-binding protein
VPVNSALRYPRAVEWWAMENIVLCKNVSKEYKLGRSTINAVNNVDLKIPKGSFVSIVGPSGSGKTTLLNMIGTIDKPTAGTVLISGQNVDHLRDSQLSLFRAKKIGFVFQVFNLIPVFTVYENVEYPLIFSKHSKGLIKDKVNEIIEAVGLGPQKNQKPNQLSGGQRQRVSIARALVIEPELVLADEPTANLDSKTGMEILKLMKKMNEKYRTTFIFSTHDPDVMKLARKKYILHDGRLIK